METKTQAFPQQLSGKAGCHSGVAVGERHHGGGEGCWGPAWRRESQPMGGVRATGAPWPQAPTAALGPRYHGRREHGRGPEGTGPTNGAGCHGNTPTPRGGRPCPRSTHAPQPPCPRRARPANCPNSNSHPRRPITARGRGVRPASPPPSGQSWRLLCLKKKCARLIGVAQTSWAYGGRGQFRPPQGDASGGAAWAELAACAFPDPS